MHAKYPRSQTSPRGENGSSYQKRQQNFFTHPQSAYEELQDGRDDRRFRPRIGLETNFPDESDTEAFMRDMITVTPLSFDWTAYPVLDKLGGWNLSHDLTR